MKTDESPRPPEMDGPTWSVLAEVLAEPTLTRSHPDRKRINHKSRGKTSLKAPTHLALVHLCAAGRSLWRSSHVTGECEVGVERRIRNTDALGAEDAGIPPI